MIMLAVFAIIIPNTVFSQSQIGAFYGVKLGMPKYEVKSKLESQGRTVVVKSTKSEYKPEYYLVKSPKLGDVVFDELRLFFSGSKLVKAIFINDDGAGGMPSADAFNRVERNGSRYKKMFNQMRSSFTSKYGSPDVEDDGELIWMKGNKLTLQYIFSDVMESDFMRQSRAMVAVIYQLSDSGSSNY